MPPPNPATISLVDASSKVRNRADLYEALQRNGYYLPLFNSSLIQVGWMQQVRDRAVWCPKYSDIRLKPCPTPPSLTEVVEMLVGQLEKTGRSAGITKKKMPDLRWALDVLATVDPFNDIFDKGYRPNKRQKVEAPNDTVPNFDSFYDGLPLSKAKRVSQRMFVPKRDPKEAQKKLEAQIQKLQLRL